MCWLAKRLIYGDNKVAGFVFLMAFRGLRLSVKNYTGGFDATKVLKRYKEPSHRLKQFNLISS